MKYILFTVLVSVLLLFGCSQSSTPKNEQAVDSSKELAEIEKLIRRVLQWSDSDNAIGLLPVLTDERDSFYVGFDLILHQKNLEKLHKSELFAAEFIENYNQIVLTLDKGIRSGRYEPWLVGELPPFSFANGWNPWCCAQDNCSSETFQIEPLNVNDDSAELIFKREKDSAWINFIIRIKRENGILKIAYLQGFDYNQSVKEDGELGH